MLLVILDECSGSQVKALVEYAPATLEFPSATAHVEGDPVSGPSRQNEPEGMPWVIS